MDEKSIADFRRQALLHAGPQTYYAETGHRVPRQMIEQIVERQRERSALASQVDSDADDLYNIVREFLVERGYDEDVADEVAEGSQCALQSEMGFVYDLPLPRYLDGNAVHESAMPPHRISSPYPNTRLWWEGEGKWNMEVISGNTRRTRMFYGTHDEAKEALLEFLCEANEK